MKREPDPEKERSRTVGRWGAVRKGAIIDETGQVDVPRDHANDRHAERSAHGVLQGTWCRSLLVVDWACPISTSLWEETMSRARALTSASDRRHERADNTVIVKEHEKMYMIHASRRETLPKA